MHDDTLSRWTHEHRFHAGSSAAERGSRWVLWITAAMMVIEITAGWGFNSMALLADGWHMSLHAVAIGLSVVAYTSARRYAGGARFAFGIWKIEILGVAAVMVIGSLERLAAPQPLQYREAIAVAALGLIVNLACALILGRSHDHHGHHAHGHGHTHGHAHDHDHDHHAHGAHDDAPHADLNLRSAYLHVIADAATSVLAIVALLGGWFYGWAWLDPAMGLVGAALVAVWARGLIRDTGRILLDAEMDHPVVDEIRAAIEATPAGGTRITDLHVWRVSARTYTCALTVVTLDATLTPDDLRQRLAIHEEIVHSTIEIHRYPAVDLKP